MRKRAILACLALGAVLTAGSWLAPKAEAVEPGQPTDWNRFYYYPYIYYPHNFAQPETYNNLYYRYPPARQIPVYNRSWNNFYPEKKHRAYHMGHHFILDVF